MEVTAAELGVGLQLAEVVEQVLVAPLVVALGSPGIEVLGYTTQENLPVDGAAASGYLAPGNLKFAAGVSAAATEIPVVVMGNHIDARGEAELDFLGQMLEIGVVRPGFQQQHRAMRVFAESGSDHAAPGSPRR